MKIICVEEHPIDPATDKAARPAVLNEAPYFGLMDSPNAASRLNDLSVPLYAHPGIPLPDVQQAYYRLPPRSPRTKEFLGKLPVSEQNRGKIAYLNAEKLFTL
jgi:hypothetical protein